MGCPAGDTRNTNPSLYPEPVPYFPYTLLISQLCKALNPKPSTLNPKKQTLNPEPQNEICFPRLMTVVVIALIAAMFKTGGFRVRGFRV